MYEHPSIKAKTSSPNGGHYREITERLQRDYTIQQMSYNLRGGGAPPLLVNRRTHESYMGSEYPLMILN